MKKHCLLIVLFSLILFSCQREEKLSEPIFEIEEVSVTAVAAGGEYRISYTLENPVPDETISADLSADWIKGFNTEEAGIIKFHVDANPETDSRYAEVTLTYAGIERGFVVHQDAADPDAPKFIINEKEVEVDAEGGFAKVTYTIENGIPGTPIEFKEECEWIDQFNTMTAGEIQFSVDANEVEEPREALVTAVYSGIEQSFTVKQKEMQPEFSIEIENVTEFDVTFGVYPRDKELTYVARVAEKSYFEEMGSDENVFNKNMEYFQSLAEQAGVSIYEVLEIALMKGDITGQNVPGLDPNTEYYLYCYGLSPAGEMLTGITNYLFKTNMVDQVAMDFSFDIQTDGPDAIMTVSPSDDQQTYYYNVVNKAAIEEAGMTIEDYLQEDIDFQRQVGEMFGIPAEEMLKNVLCTGKQFHEYTDLAAEAEHFAAAAAFTADGWICSEVVTESFTTGAVEPSDNQIAIEIGVVNMDRAKIKVDVTNNDPYLFFVDKTSTWSGLSDEEIMETITTEYDVSQNVFSGDKEFEVSGLTAETEYSVFVFGYKAQVITTGLTKASFTTSEASTDPSTLQFEFTVENIKVKGADITIKGTPETAGYLWDITPANVTADQIIDNINATVDMYLRFGLAASRAEYMASVVSRGTVNASYKNLASNMEYRLYAIGIYDETGEFATDVIFSDTFKTLEETETALRMNVEYKYYEADDLVEYTDRAERYPGYIALRMKADFTGGAYGNFRYTCYEGNFMDPDVTSDDVVIENLNNSGQNVLECVIFYPNRDSQHTILGYAEDLNGNMAPVFRKLIESFPEEGLSDPETYTMPFDQSPSFTSAPIWIDAAPQKAEYDFSINHPAVKTENIETVLFDASEKTPRPKIRFYQKYDFSK